MFRIFMVMIIKIENWCYYGVCKMFWQTMNGVKHKDNVWNVGGSGTQIYFEVWIKTTDRAVQRDTSHVLIFVLESVKIRLTAHPILTRIHLFYTFIPVSTCMSIPLYAITLLYSAHLYSILIYLQDFSTPSVYM